MDEHESYEKLMRHPGEPTSLFVQLRCPTINNAYISERLKLPQQFLGAMTLKEGTFVTIVWLQSVAVAFTAYLSVYITKWKAYGDFIWELKFEADYDPYLKGEERKTIDYLYPLWDDMAFALAVAHTVYFVTGLGVCYGLCHNHCHPWVYWPWMLMTGYLVAMTYLSSFLMFIVLFLIRRPLSVTWDFVPMICVFLYAVAWTYGFLIVIAHYKRRLIVRFWRKNKRREFFGGQ